MNKKNKAQCKKIGRELAPVIEQEEEHASKTYEAVSELAALRHEAHCKRKINCDTVNTILVELGIEEEVYDMDDVHDIINPMLLIIDREIEKNTNELTMPDKFASHGIRALKST